MSKRILTLLMVLFMHSTSIGQNLSIPVDNIKIAQKAKVMVLGVFHFDNPGLDDYKPEYQVNIHSEERQTQIDEIVQKLSGFDPSKMGLEFKYTEQARIDSLYALYAEGRFELPGNEIYQLGFRLAHRSGLKEVYGIDAPGKSYLSIAELNQEEYNKKVDEYMQLGLSEKPNTTIWYPIYQELYKYEDSLKMKIPLQEYLQYINNPKRIEVGHGQYLVDSFKFGLGREDDYLGADMKTRWYNRNLRILQNIYRLIDSANDRVLVIIGAGHLPILKHSIQSSPELEWVEITSYLN